MSESPQKKQDILEFARHEFAQLSAELEKLVEALKDPERRKQLTSSSLDVLQKGLSRAQDTIAKYQKRAGPQGSTEVSEDDVASGMPPAAGPMPTPAPPPEPPITRPPEPPISEPPTS